MFSVSLVTYNRPKGNWKQWTATAFEIGLYLFTLRHSVLTLIGYPWKFLKAYFSIMSPKFGVKHDTQVKNTAKYAKCSWRERGYFIRDNISPSGVNRTDNTQASPEFTHALHCFINIFFNIFLPWPGDTVRLQLRESSPTFDKVRELE